MYLPFPETKQGVKDSGPSIRRRSDVGSWEMEKRFAILLIKIRIRKDQSRIIERGSAILLLKYHFFLRRNLRISRCEEEEETSKVIFPVISKMGVGQEKSMPEEEAYSPATVDTKNEDVNHRTQDQEGQSQRTQQIGEIAQ